MLRRWNAPAAIALTGALIAAIAGSMTVLVVCSLGALIISPLAFPRPLTAEQARHRSDQDGRAIVYWRPSCPFCLRLRVALLGRRAHWVDIWRDPGAAAAVRAVADGNETVPTVIVAGVAHVNPNPLWLRRTLQGVR
ncbi:glutaredoxin domain-containing protein [Krasilnikovia sp. M28-CT-15]|uniref:glutaredoxin domain-containing protein n=1 Tax=Krasilnikovia sp. M28-CT-15 TaxID=3373540 RepID=UPI00387642CE